MPSGLIHEKQISGAIVRAAVAQLAAAGCISFLFLLKPTPFQTPAEKRELFFPPDAPSILRIVVEPQGFSPSLDDTKLSKRAEETEIPPDATLHYLDLLHAEAGKTDLPADIADAVAYIESGFSPDAIGDVGEVGLMQVRPGTAAMLGFKGSDGELALPATNIRYGVTYLAGAWRLAKGDLCRALMKYRAGHGEERMTARSVEYCARAKAYLKRIGSSLGVGGPASSSSLEERAAPALTLASSRETKGFAASIQNPILRGARGAFAGLDRSERFWAAHDARIRVMKQRVYAKWRQMANRRGGERIVQSKL